MVSVRALKPARAVFRDGSTVVSRNPGGVKPYYATIGPLRGPVIYSEALLAIGVTKRWRGGVPIGAALCVGRDETGVALWELTIGKVEVPGRWVLMDREFLRPESTARECSRIGQRQRPGL
jgi:hypothetical protein